MGVLPAGDETNLCTTISESNPFNFTIDWKVGTGEINSTQVYVEKCSTAKVNGVDERVKIINDALKDSLGILSSVGLVGTSSLLVISFDPTVSFVKLRPGNVVNPFGLKDDVQTKRNFQFAAGLNEVLAQFEIGGSAEIAASVGPIDIEADISANLAGSVELSAGNKGVLLPINDWLSKMKNITEPENAGFATVKATIDGSFDASASALGFDVSANGRLIKPFVLDLLNRTAIAKLKPEVFLNVDLPNIGDLRNLNLKDVIKLLEVCGYS